MMMGQVTHHDQILISILISRDGIGWLEIEMVPQVKSQAGLALEQDGLLKLYQQLNDLDPLIKENLVTLLKHPEVSKNDLIFIYLYLFIFFVSSLTDDQGTGQSIVDVKYEKHSLQHRSLQDGPVYPHRGPKRGKRKAQPTFEGRGGTQEVSSSHRCEDVVWWSWRAIAHRHRDQMDLTIFFSREQKEVQRQTELNEKLLDVLHREKERKKKKRKNQSGEGAQKRQKREGKKGKQYCWDFANKGICRFGDRCKWVKIQNKIN